MMLFVRGAAGPLALSVSRKTSRTERDVALDIERSDASLTSGVQAISASIGRYVSGCWKNLLDVDVGLTGKGARTDLMLVVVRH
jgi:hypothetical protein